MLAAQRRKLDEQNKQISNTSEQKNQSSSISEPLEQNKPVSNTSEQINQAASISKPSEKLDDVTKTRCTTKKTTCEKMPKPSLRFNGKTHLPKFDDDDERKGYRCKLEGCSKQTTAFCETCNVHLCIKPGKKGRSRNCFRIFHILNED